MHSGYTGETINLDPVADRKEFCCPLSGGALQTRALIKARTPPFNFIMRIWGQRETKPSIRLIYETEGELLGDARSGGRPTSNGYAPGY